MAQVEAALLRNRQRQLALGTEDDLTRAIEAAEDEIEELEAELHAAKTKRDDLMEKRRNVKAGSGAARRKELEALQEEEARFERFLSRETTAA